MAKRKNQPSGQLPAFRILAELMDTLMGRDDARAGMAGGGLPDPLVSLPDDGDDSGEVDFAGGTVEIFDPRLVAMRVFMDLDAAAGGQRGDVDFKGNAPEGSRAQVF